ncbi:MAG: hypothetical protein NVS4B11_19990 [Ktedonobacteraceae bacterium]
MLSFPKTPARPKKSTAILADTIPLTYVDCCLYTKASLSSLYYLRSTNSKKACQLDVPQGDGSMLQIV